MAALTAVVVTLFGVLIMIICGFGLIFPDRFRVLLVRWDGQSRFLFAVIVRLVLGALLLSEADTLRFPAVMKFIGGIAFLAGIGLLLMGEARLNRLVGWWVARPDALLRFSLGAALLFGGFLVLAAAA
jgi:hypothetical protein